MSVTPLRVTDKLLSPTGDQWQTQLEAGDQTYPLELEGPTSQTLSVPFLAVSGALYSPTLVAGNVNAAIPFLGASGALYAPTLAAGNVTVSVPFLAANGTLYTPTLDDGTVVVIEATAPQTGAHGRKRGRELQAFLSALVEQAEPEPAPVEVKRGRKPIRLPAQRFEALPVEYQMPVLRSFRDVVAEGVRERLQETERRRLARAMREAIEKAERDAQDEDDVEALLLVM